MALVRDDAGSLLAKAEAKELHELLAQQARIRFDAATGVGEIRSWENSLPPFLADVVQAGLGHVEVLLEHRLPYTPKRVDALLCGVHPTTGRPSYVLVELKQWTTAESVDTDLVRVPQYGDQPVLHPAEQVRRYCRQLVDFTPMLAREADGVYGVAYLHNADAEGWRLKQYRVDGYGRLYTRDERQALIDRLRALLSPDPQTHSDARQAADDLLRASTTPSRQLLQHAAAEVRNRQQFVLLDEQQVAYATVEQAVELAKDENTKTVVIVLGGAGSGKSVGALSLLGDLSRAGRRVMHATGSSSFTNTLRKIVVGSRSTRVQQLFVFFNSFIGEEKNSLDVLICDGRDVAARAPGRPTARPARERGAGARPGPGVPGLRCRGRPVAVDARRHRPRPDRDRDRGHRVPCTPGRAPPHTRPRPGRGRGRTRTGLVRRRGPRARRRDPLAMRCDALRPRRRRAARHHPRARRRSGRGREPGVRVMAAHGAGRGPAERPPQPVVTGPPHGGGGLRCRLAPGRDRRGGRGELDPGREVPAHPADPAAAAAHRGPPGDGRHHGARASARRRPANHRVVGAGDQGRGDDHRRVRRTGSAVDAQRRAAQRPATRPAAGGVTGWAVRLSGARRPRARVRPGPGRPARPADSRPRRGAPGDRADPRRAPQRTPAGPLPPLQRPRRHPRPRHGVGDRGPDARHVAGTARRRARDLEAGAETGEHDRHGDRPRARDVSDGARRRSARIVLQQAVLARRDPDLDLAHLDGQMRTRDRIGAVKDLHPSHPQVVAAEPIVEPHLDDWNRAAHGGLPSSAVQQSEIDAAEAGCRALLGIG